jgi:hypothetical protein
LVVIVLQNKSNDLLQVRKWQGTETTILGLTDQYPDQKYPIYRYCMKPAATKQTMSSAGGSTLKKATAFATYAIQSNN